MGITKPQVSQIFFVQTHKRGLSLIVLIVRFVQALLRLQEKKQIPTQLVLFLHQEERALDMARGHTGGVSSC
jgi:hypothetical protein